MCVSREEPRSVIALATVLYPPTLRPAGVGGDALISTRPSADPAAGTRKPMPWPIGSASK
jgi:hypothetical protein